MLSLEVFLRRKFSMSKWLTLSIIKNREDGLLETFKLPCLNWFNIDITNLTKHQVLDRIDFLTYDIYYLNQPDRNHEAI